MEEKIIIQAGPVAVELGLKTMEDIQKLRFLVSLAGMYEYVQNGSLRLLSCEKKKEADDALADLKKKGRADLLGEVDGKFYLAADQAAALHILRKHPESFGIIDETALEHLLEEMGGSRDKAFWQKYRKLQKSVYVGTEVRLS